MVFKLQDIKPILVPQYEEHIADKTYPRVKGYIKNLADYFPEYEHDYVSQESIFGIYSQL